MVKKILLNRNSLRSFSFIGKNATGETLKNLTFPHGTEAQFIHNCFTIINKESNVMYLYDPKNNFKKLGTISDIKEIVATPHGLFINSNQFLPKATLEELL